MVHLFSRGNQLPPWVNESLTATELDKALKNHITKVMDHYRGKLYAIDVIVRFNASISSYFSSYDAERDDIGQYTKRNVQAKHLD